MDLRYCQCGARLAALLPPDLLSLTLRALCVPLGSGIPVSESYDNVQRQTEQRVAADSGGGGGARSSDFGMLEWPI